LSSRRVAWVAAVSNHKFRVAGLALVLAVCAGCQRAHDANTMAMVNGKPILRSDVEKIYRNNLGDSHQTPSPVQSNIMRLNILRQLIDEPPGRI
jgi:peptidyl-prolyl cis-trans isomerase SurA